MRKLLSALGLLGLVLMSASLARADVSWPIAVRAQLLRLAEVDWRMRRAAVASCPRQSAGFGILIDHAGAYSQVEPSVLAGLLYLNHLPQIAAVAQDSPGAHAGLRPGDVLVAINGADMASALARSAEPTLFADEVMDRLAALPPGQPVTLLLRRGNMSLRKTIMPEATCASRAVLDTSPALDAHSDSSDMAITSALVDFAENDDELALIVGHELAHVILQREPSAQSFDAVALERSADLLGAAIAHCAGYDVDRAAAFWPRYRAMDAQARARLPTHPSPDRRAQSIRAALPKLSCPVNRSAFIPR